MIPTSPAAFSTTGPGAYTQSTGSNIGAYTLSIPASQLGPNDGLSVYVNASYANDANIEVCRDLFGKRSLFLGKLHDEPQLGRHCRFQKQGFNRLAGHHAEQQQLRDWNLARNLTTMSVNTAAAQNLVVNAQLTNAADYIVIQSVNVQFLPAVN